VANRTGLHTDRLSGPHESEYHSVLEKFLSARLIHDFREGCPSQPRCKLMPPLIGQLWRPEEGGSERFVGKLNERIG
jgi:hypothetical protein